MIEWGAIAPKDLDLLQWVDTPEQAFERLRTHLMTPPPRARDAAGNRAPGYRQDAG